MQLIEACDEILVIEDGQPFVEKQIKGYLGIGVKVKGRLDGTLPHDGELTPTAWHCRRQRQKSRIQHPIAGRSTSTCTV